MSGQESSPWFFDASKFIDGMPQKDPTLKAKGALAALQVMDPHAYTVGAAEYRHMQQDPDAVLTTDSEAAKVYDVLNEIARRGLTVRVTPINNGQNFEVTILTPVRVRT